MSELIERETAIKTVTNLMKNEDDWYREAFKSAIRAIPSARPKEGKWIDMGDFEQCSVCKGTHLKEFQTYYGKATWIKTDFCPNCGARMKGDRP